MKDINLKILVIGESGVGKSSLMTRFVDGKFNDNEVNSEFFLISYKTKTQIPYNYLFSTKRAANNNR